MPSKKVVEKAKKELKQGYSPTTAAGEFVREEFHHVRQGKHGAKSKKQVVAIGLSKARRAGLPLPPPPGERRAGSRSRAPQAKRTPTHGRTARRSGS